MFLGYDLPDYISEDDIMRFMIKFKQVVVDIEVIKNKKWGNYAKVTFQTVSDARSALYHYDGQYWTEHDLYVFLKPWKTKIPDMSYLSPSKKTGSPIITSSGTKNASHYASSENLAGSRLSNQKLHYSSCKNLTSRFYKSHEYTIKLSGLKTDVRKQEITKLVTPFGELTIYSPIKVVSYSKTGVCYAYVNFCSKQSAVTAVSHLDQTWFDGRLIHVCHKGELEVEHSCAKELDYLMTLELSSNTSTSHDEDGRRSNVINKSQAQTSESMSTLANILRHHILYLYRYLLKILQLIFFSLLLYRPSKSKRCYCKIPYTRATKVDASVSFNKRK